MSKMLLFSTFFLSISYVLSADPVITLPNGQIRGIAEKTERNNMPFYAYLGIPFAAPPIGDLRFQPPQPPANWDGIFEAKTNNKICYQVGIDNTMETEDCLYINVYTPVAPGSDAVLPVIFYIYGTFIHGYAMIGIQRPEFLLEQNVIVVTINYRVGPFGFLSTGDSVLPGNMGLKDQQFGLKWVQTNIHLFGGDPSKVTIMGQSAGGASVTYQILSPGSAGLFRAAISESASALCTWAYQRYAKETAYGIAAEIDAKFTSDRSTQELLEYLQSVDAKDIDNTADKYKVFAPVIEVEHDEAMITEPMYEAVANGRINKVPLLIGMTSEEEIVLAANLENLAKNMRILERNVQVLADEDMYISDETLRATAAEAIRAVYTDGLFQDNLTAAVLYFSDNRFMRGIIKYADLQSQYTDVYFYQFSYHGILGGNNISMEGIGRVGHAEDTKYLWAGEQGTDLSTYPASDVTTLDRYVTLFTNFVKTLNPIPQQTDLLQNIIWPKVTPDEFIYLDIDENLELRQSPREFSYKQWEEIYDTYATKPLISY